MDESRKVTLEDVAAAAGVSLATADRAVNGRAGVRPETVARVQAAVERLGYRPDPTAVRLSRGGLWRFHVVLPTSGTPETIALRRSVVAQAPRLERDRAIAEPISVPAGDPAALAGAVLELRGRSDGIVLVGVDHPAVEAAVDAAVDDGVPVVTLLADVARSRRRAFVGLDDVAAGRTAGHLFGRLAGGRNGTVAVPEGDPVRRDHAERRFGFGQVLAQEFPGLVPVSIAAGPGGDAAAIRQAADLALVSRPDLVGFYDPGGYAAAFAEAIRSAPRGTPLIHVGHGSEPSLRRDLIEGGLDAVLDADLDECARAALDALMASVLGEPLPTRARERRRAAIRMRDNFG